MNHGTMQGVWRHNNRKDPLCEACMPLWVQYVKDHPPKKTRAMRIDSPETSAFDKLLAEDPPEIEWALCPRRRVMVARKIHDPHQDAAGRRSAA